MAAPFLSTPLQPYVYHSPQVAVTPFQILGGEAQIVQVMLKPQEKVIAKPGSMCFMSGSIEMENTDGFIGIAAPSLARVLPIDLAMFGGVLLCQPDAFLCSINDVKVNNTVDQRPRNIKYNGPIRRAVFGGDNLVTAVLTGPGTVFIQSWPFQRFSQRIARAVTSPNVRENPKFFVQIDIFLFIAYVVIVSSLILTDV
ncbi:DWNN domain isoform 1 [Hibiscus syriacus]|uniref:DWNN domain isoform 1 n=1 Tax=Hibiscus syriacus TaxID=106335 RepID=A0A6A3AW85_HIBSY|nr:DWNN domain isoform 1 [Hibiscus syriacus]